MVHFTVTDSVIIKDPGIMMCCSGPNHPVQAGEVGPQPHLGALPGLLQVRGQSLPGQGQGGGHQELHGGADQGDQPQV